jgi:hypothetical protein
MDKAHSLTLDGTSLLALRWTKADDIGHKWLNVSQPPTPH